MNEEQSTTHIYHTVIIGAGASGLFCAGSFDAPKLVLEAQSSAAQKVFFSGGKKCNFTNKFVSAADYDCTQKHFCKNALAAFKPKNFTDLLDEALVPYEEREDGKLFGKSSSDIVDFLETRAKAHHTEIKLHTRVVSVQKTPLGFTLDTNNGIFQAKNVVLASGGPSFRILSGSTFGREVAREMHLPFIPQRPALCELEMTATLRKRFTELAGSSLTAAVQVEGKTITHSLLFTHRGISGPAVLSASLYWHKGQTVTIDFLPQESAEELWRAHKNSTRTLSSVLSEKMPVKIARALVADWDQPLANISNEHLKAAAQQVHAFTFIPAGANREAAEVTAGGIDTRCINPSTFEVKNIAGLYIIGEVLDVTGRLGGFNLHWAWASGFCAGQALGKKPA